MDDKSIIALYTKGDLTNLKEKHLLALMSLARGDQTRLITRERQKSRRIWISWNSEAANYTSYISLGKPKCRDLFGNKRYVMNDPKYSRLSPEICRYLDIEPGDCQQFEIRRVK